MKFQLEAKSNLWADSNWLLPASAVAMWWDGRRWGAAVSALGEVQQFLMPPTVLRTAKPSARGGAVSTWLMRGVSKRASGLREHKTKLGPPRELSHSSWPERGLGK